MSFLRRIRERRASSEAMEQYESDRKLAARYSELLSIAGSVERELRSAQAQRRPFAEVRAHNEALDQALADALATALAGERAAKGPLAYDDRIARRRAAVREDVRRWTGEVSVLRTARETFRLEGMSRTGTLIPNYALIGSHAMSSPPIPGVEPGQPDDAPAALDEPRVGVDLDEAVGEHPAHT